MRETASQGSNDEQNIDLVKDITGNGATAEIFQRGGRPQGINGVP
jgi:hypothetical protein